MTRRYSSLERRAGDHGRVKNGPSSFWAQMVAGAIPRERSCQGGVVPLPW